MRARERISKKASYLFIAPIAIPMLLTLGSARAYGEEGLTTAAASKLRQHCGACHGLGPLRFIWSGDDRELWRTLYSTRAPASGKTWAEGIAKVLSWPSDAPPPFDQVMEPGRDWMPKGIKRVELANDMAGGMRVRRLILEALARGPGN